MYTFVDYVCFKEWSNSTAITTMIFFSQRDTEYRKKYISKLVMLFLPILQFNRCLVYIIYLMPPISFSTLCSLFFFSTLPFSFTTGNEINNGKEEQR